MGKLSEQEKIGIVKAKGGERFNTCSVSCGGVYDISLKKVNGFSNHEAICNPGQLSPRELWKLKSGQSKLELIQKKIKSGQQKYRILIFSMLAFQRRVKIGLVKEENIVLLEDLEATEKYLKEERS